MSSVSRDFLLEPEDKNRLAYLIGPQDQNLLLLQKRLNVKIAYLGGHFHVEGEEHLCRVCEKILKDLYVQTAATSKNKITDITPNMVHLALVEAHVLDQENDHKDQPSRGHGRADKGYDKGQNHASSEIEELYEKAHSFKTKRGRVRPRTPNQSDYMAAINTHDVCFGVGPAGTGKTYLAVAAAVDALERNEVRRIILTRPAIEAGEKLGFLPGDLTQKVDPYLRPLYDALYEMLGFDKVQKLIERQVIEIAPLAYMRGRTLNDSFIILDESQNTTVEQMKMFLTRIGFNSKAVITGDPSQIDLPRHIRSGLKQAVEVLGDLEEIAIICFKSEDVVRHPVVAAIVTAYERFEAVEQQRQAEQEQRRRALKLQRMEEKPPVPAYHSLKRADDADEAAGPEGNLSLHTAATQPPLDLAAVVDAAPESQTPAGEGTNGSEPRDGE